MNRLFKYILFLLVLIRPALSQNDVEVEFKIIQLSYIQTDRLAGILKAIGYSVIEFEADRGVNPNELVLSPVGNFNESIYQGYLAKKGDLPIVIVIPETENITFLELESEASKAGSDMSVDMGGSSLVHTTAGEPLQRLLIAYDPKDTVPLYALLDVIKNKIDVAAKQVVIDALVLEIYTDKISELGINYSASASPYTFAYSEPSEETGSFSPFTMVLDKTLLGQAFDFSTKIQALVESKDASILSRPSVIVVDGRQARIVVGQQIPITQTTASAQFATTSTSYIPVGIVLNLRPRISEDGRHISMQVETIISETEEKIGLSFNTGVLNAPTINSRKVQTYVEVPNNTPFIIGGLTFKKITKQRGGIPGLSSIPFLGKLFSFNISVEHNKEVIVLITPHLVEIEEDHFTKVIPKDSDLFQRFGTELYHNTYRIQNKDIFNLGFYQNSNLYESTIEKVSELDRRFLDAKDNAIYSNLLKGEVPGEEILIRRMLYNLIERVDYYKYINSSQIYYYTNDDDFIDLKSFSAAYSQYLKTSKGKKKSFALTFKKEASGITDQNKLNRPTAETVVLPIPINYKKKLAELNKTENSHTILLQEVKHERRLYETLILMKVLELNPGITDNISMFKPGLEIIFPTQEELEEKTYILDDKVAQYFYQINDYNNVFDAQFFDGMNELNEYLDSLSNK
jgi:general secretion pathway protein D